MMRRPSQIALTLLGGTLLIGSIYVISARVIKQGFQRVEDDSVQNNVLRMKHAMDDQIAQLDSVAAPWSQWSDASTFANAPRPLATAFVRDELSDSAVANLAANAIVYARRDGRVVFAAGYDPKASKSRAFPRGLRDFLTRHPSLLRHRDFLSRKTGILMLPEGPMMFASQPLLQSSATGAVQGAFLVGRYLNSGTARQMSQRVENEVEVRALSAPLPPDFAAARIALENPASRGALEKFAPRTAPENLAPRGAIRALNEQTIAGYALMKDWSGHPALISRVSAPRGIYAEAHRSLTTLLLSTGGIGALGALLLLLAQGRLTSARRESEEEQNRFRLVFEGLGEGVILTDLNDVVSNVNAQMQNITGYSAPEMIGHPAYELLLPRDEWPDMHQHNQQRASGQAENYETHLLRRDGSKFWAMVHATPLRDASGTVVGTIGALMDINARKEAERLLQQSQTELREALTERRLMMETNPDVIFRLDLGGHLTGWNRRLEEVTTLSRDELQDRHAVAFFAPEDAPRIVEAIGNALQLGFATVEAALLRPELEPLPMAWTAVPLHGEDGQLLGVTGSGRDITERQKAELSMRAALREKEVLLKEIHHRVKNNLQIISSLLSWQADVLSDAAAREALEESRQRVRSMALIHEKLYQSDDLARVDFSEYLSNLCQSLMRSYSDKGTRATLDLEVENVHLEVDLAVPCGLIVNELVTNALKYAFPGGRSGVIGVSLRAGADNRVELSVGDNGVGLPDDFDLGTSESIGTQLVTGLCDQLEASYTLDGTCGTRWTLSFLPS